MGNSTSSDQVTTTINDDDVVDIYDDDLTGIIAHICNNNNFNLYHFFSF